jgi:peptide-methionine (R)-S-oxide reductase
MKLFSLIFLLSFVACQAQSQKGTSKSSAHNNEGRTVTPEYPSSIVPIEKSNEEWAKELNQLEYYVLREAGTERPFTDNLWDNKEKGIYVCRACNLALFSSETKYKSGTGWPSFYKPIVEDYVKEDTDYLLGYARTEVLCARCGGHLGHVFPDGPKPTGLRYCMNGASLDFVAKLPEATIK